MAAMSDPSGRVSKLSHDVTNRLLARTKDENEARNTVKIGFCGL